MQIILVNPCERAVLPSKCHVPQVKNHCLRMLQTFKVPALLERDDCVCDLLNWKNWEDKGKEKSIEGKKREEEGRDDSNSKKQGFGGPFVPSDHTWDATLKRSYTMSDQYRANYSQGMHATHMHPHGALSN